MPFLLTCWKMRCSAVLGVLWGAAPLWASSDAFRAPLGRLGAALGLLGTALVWWCLEKLWGALEQPWDTLGRFWVAFGAHCEAYPVLHPSQSNHCVNLTLSYIRLYDV